MNEQILKIAARVKDLREFNDISVADMAKKLGIEDNEYNEFENGIAEMQIGMFYNIAKILQIDPTVLLTGANSEMQDCAVVYDGKGVSVKRYDGYEFISLASKFYGRAMEPMIVNIKPDVKPELLKHTGQEFNYVLEGKLRVLVGKSEYFLHKGDSIYFNSNQPHAQIAMENPAKFLTVILEK